MNLHYAFQTPDKLYLVLDFINGKSKSAFKLVQKTFSILSNEFL